MLKNERLWNPEYRFEDRAHSPWVRGQHGPNPMRDLGDFAERVRRVAQTSAGEVLADMIAEGKLVLLQGETDWAWAHRVCVQLASQMAGKDWSEDMPLCMSSCGWLLLDRGEVNGHPEAGVALTSAGELLALQGDISDSDWEVNWRRLAVVTPTDRDEEE